ncbi:MAG: GNVR domain-containing protein, partial [Aeromonas sp.]
KWAIMLTTLLGAAIAVAVALYLPNVYKAEALLAPSTEQSGGGLSAMAAQFGGLASLAGVNLNSGGPAKTDIAVEVAKSRQFLTQFIRKYQLEVPLLAVTHADKVSGELVIDPKIYDAPNKQWVREVKPPQSVAPSDWELVKAARKIFNVSIDKKSGLANVSVEYFSPQVAKNWVDWLVADLNAEMKQRDQANVKRNIAYLTEQLAKTPIADMQKVFYQLIEEQTKNLMLTEVHQEYVFRTLDPAVIAEEKDKPKRALIAVLGTLLGAMLGVMVVLIRHALRREAA